MSLVSFVERWVLSAAKTFWSVSFPGGSHRWLAATAPVPANEECMRESTDNKDNCYYRNTTTVTMKTRPKFWSGNHFFRRKLWNDGQNLQSANLYSPSMIILMVCLSDFSSWGWTSPSLLRQLMQLNTTLDEIPINSTVPCFIGVLMKCESFPFVSLCPWWWRADSVQRNWESWPKSRVKL